MSALCFTVGSNGQVTYGGVTEEGFIINPVTGVITTTKELDAELQDHYTLTGTKISIVLNNFYTHGARAHLFTQRTPSAPV